MILPLMLLLLGFLTACGAIAPTTSMIAQGQVISWKNYVMPDEVFRFPEQGRTVQEEFGPSGSDAGWIWYKSNIPKNPIFKKQRDDTTIECTFIVDVHPTTTSTVFLSMMIHGKTRLTGFQLQGNTHERGIFTFAPGRIAFREIPAGDVAVTLWFTTVKSNPTWVASNVEVMQCFEILYPKAQDPGEGNMYIK